MKNIYIVGTAYHYAKFIDDCNIVESMDNADIVLFTGGEDVFPGYYGENRHPSTFYNQDRDIYEEKQFNLAVAMNKNIIGICRGSQFTTVMSGGKLVQDVNNHGIHNTHDILFPDTNEILDITSTHHQMMNPFGMKEDEFIIIAESHPKRSTSYQNGDEKEIEMACEPEIVFYPKTNVLAIQGHPEYMNKKKPIIPKINSLINTIFYGKKV